MGGKNCRKCGEWKEYVCFPKRKEAKDGHRNECKECIKEYDRSYREENFETMSERLKEYYLNNSKRIKDNRLKRYYDNIETEREYNREFNKRYHQENKDVIYEKKKIYRQENVEKIKEQKRIYNNSEQGRDVNYKASVKRRSYKYNVDFKPVQRKQLLDRDNWTCKHCGIKVHDRKENTSDKANIDHIIPISKGGNSEPSNLQVLCRTCNLSKADKIAQTIQK
jgi:5-methylcytosine-specific restriction endonuclease McrA